MDGGCAVEYDTKSYYITTYWVGMYAHYIQQDSKRYVVDLHIYNLYYHTLIMYIHVHDKKSTDERAFVFFFFFF